MRYCVVGTSDETRSEYRLRASECPDHAKLFTVEVLVGNQVVGQGQGRNKKQAELNAARQALETLAATN